MRCIHLFAVLLFLVVSKEEKSKSTEIPLRQNTVLPNCRSFFSYSKCYSDWNVDIDRSRRNSQLNWSCFEHFEFVKFGWIVKVWIERRYCILSIGWQMAETVQIERMPMNRNWRRKSCMIDRFRLEYRHKSSKWVYYVWIFILVAVNRCATQNFLHIIYFNYTEIEYVDFPLYGYAFICVHEIPLFLSLFFRATIHSSQLAHSIYKLYYARFIVHEYVNSWNAWSNTPSYKEISVYCMELTMSKRDKNAQTTTIKWRWSNHIAQVEYIYYKQFAGVNNLCE